MSNVEELLESQVIALEVVVGARPDCDEVVPNRPWEEAVLVEIRSLHVGDAYVDSGMIWFALHNFTTLIVYNSVGEWDQSQRKAPLDPVVVRFVLAVELLEAVAGHNA